MYKSYTFFKIVNCSIKNVYVVRNPKDVITSYFHFHKLFRVCEFNGDMELFAHYIMDDMRNFDYFYPNNSDDSLAL